MSSLFTSKLEKRLWLWTLIVMMAIYATLNTAGRLAAVLRERGLVEISLNGVLVCLIIGFLVWLVANRRPSWGEVGVAVGVIFVYWFSWFRIITPEERTHLIEYSVVAALIYQALLERQRNGRDVWRPALLALGIAISLGWLDEGIQAILPNRYYSLVDVLFNTLAAVMAISASVALNWVRGYVATKKI